MQTIPLPYWVQIVQALGPTFIAVAALAITGYFAWRQWKTARDKVRFDIFQLRYTYFIALRDFLIEILREGNAPSDKLNEYVRKMVGAEFVFEKDIVDYIEEIRVRSIKLRMIHVALERVSDGIERSETADNAAKLFMSFTNEFETLERRFAKSLGLARI
jgi:hypothetical protein